MGGFDLLIKGGTIVDGTLSPRYVADIGIRDGKIVSIRPDLGTVASRTIDASGKIVAPGVIDPHTHYDAQINWDPYCTNSGWHGNTSFVVGNCGFGFMPCKPADRDRYMQMMESTEQVPLGAMRAALPWTWETYPEWMEHMKRLPKGVNVASFMPLNSLMIYVMGYEAAKTRGATDAERKEMRRLLNEAMDAGAIGFGLSHLNMFNSHKDCDGSPMITDTMVVEDAYYLAEVLRERGRGAIQVLAELPVVVSNREVCEKLCEISGRPVLHTVVTPFDKLPAYHRGVLTWLDECRNKGLEIYSQALAFRAWNEFDVIDYNAWQMIDPFFEFSNVGDAAAKTRLAADPAFRQRAREQYLPANMEGAGGAIDSFKLIKAPGAPEWDQYLGMLFSDIAAKRNCATIDAFFDVVVATDSRAEFRTTDATSNDPYKIREVLGHPRVVAGTSDGGAHVKFYVGGHFATDNIMQMVRETGLMKLEELHHKFSAIPARIFGFDNRGTLEEGNWADLYVYDFDEIGYNTEKFDVAYDLPGGDWRKVVKAEGIEHIVVNGEVTFENGIPTGALPGKMLSYGQGPLEIDTVDQLEAAE